MRYVFLTLHISLSLSLSTWKDCVRSRILQLLDDLWQKVEAKSWIDISWKKGEEREKSYCFPLSTFRITLCHFSSSTPMLKGRQWANIFLFLREVPSVFIGNFHTFPSDKRNCEDLLGKLTTYENSHFITPSKCDIILRHRTTIGMSTSRFNIFTTRKIGTRLKIDNLTRFE